MTVNSLAAPPVAADSGEIFLVGPPPPRLGHRFTVLDSLRGVCAVMVCLFHFSANGPVAASSAVRGSWLFVDFFFVLSGFVITANYRQRLTEGRFLRSFVILRLGRIYPLHLVMLLAFMAVEFAGVVMNLSGESNRQMFDAHRSVPAIFTNLTLLQSIGLHDRMTWNQPAWSIAVEFWTYLLFACLVRNAGDSLEKWLVAIVGGSIVALMLLTPSGIGVTYSWSLVRCVYGFSVGALAWWIWQASRFSVLPPFRFASLVEIGAVVAVVGFVSLCDVAPANLVAPLLFGAVILIFARESGSVSRWLLAPALQHLGLLSFSIYMVHTFVQARFVDALRVIEHITHVDLISSRLTGSGRAITAVGTTPWQGVLLTLIMLAIVVGVSQLTWRWVEVPGQRWARRRAALA